jgi:translation initiation factor 1
LTIKKNNKNYAIIYSTDHGKMCAGCGKAVANCACSQNRSNPKGDGIVRVGRETIGRKGKSVTVITGVPLDHSELTSLGKELKKKCGSGGTVKNSKIEIQGDHRDKLLVELRKHGWTVKKSGG